ncbi:NAD(P)/FAD-dependent oxidoreductase [Pseudodesulfovibrio sp. JC047]|uniref:dihydrolipoyl dehydrogenase family protein n=1 Tax=Pseudodesulfovibrio sp. JC047 TaxID=2683199 RepID=UPI0013D4FE73|nr:NAD(P)/FAD-dependent oxidoreductase [Pseudodesulfovibrio sp. JC047]NDV18602.1 NAD(P)/FAD-dependent oxidoreductase [Pseudodesulfovibrio sp. JC047]
MKKRAFDVVVVGSGTAAYYAVAGLKQHSNMTIAIVDERPYGGTCALRGCQPKKYLVSNAESVASVSHLLGRGLEGEVRTNWGALQRLKNEFLQGRSEAAQAHWDASGVTTFNGTARMRADDQIEVGGQVLTAKTIVLATGSLPNQLPIEGGALARDSEYFLDMEKMPERVTFIGGGFISFEFAHVAIRGGASAVHILHRSARPLRAFEDDLVAVLLKASAAAGIDVQLGVVPERIVATETGYSVHSASGAVIETDLIIEATGRHPNLTVLDGNMGNVAFSSKGVEVNSFLQSVSNPRVYAIGDCADTPYMLAPVADREGQIAALNIVHGNSHEVDETVVPSAVFSIPTLASVGLTEEAAREQSLKYRVNQGDTTDWPSSKRIGEEYGAYKVLIDADTDLILGAHILRHNAAEVVNVFALAIQFNISASALANFLWAYPTSTSDLKYMVK